MAKEIPDFVKCGVIEEEPDPRDYTLDMIIKEKKPEKYPKRFQHKYPFKPKNQGRVASCVAHALTSVREINFDRKGVKAEFSPGFTYACRVKVNTAHMGPGMITSAALREMRKVGAMLQEDFPWHEEMPGLYESYFKPDKEKWTSMAKEFRVDDPVGTYARLRSIDEIFEALYNLGPVVIGMRMFREYEDPPWSENDYRMTAPIIGTERESHLMVIVGWEKDAFIILNSWGENWKDGGYFYMPFEFFNHKDLNCRAYVIKEKWFGENEEEDDIMKSLIVVNDCEECGASADIEYARLLSNKYKGTVAYRSQLKNTKFKAETAYICGGGTEGIITDGFEKIVDLSGNNRFETVGNIEEEFYK